MLGKPAQISFGLCGFLALTLACGSSGSGDGPGLGGSSNNGGDSGSAGTAGDPTGGGGHGGSGGSSGMPASAGIQMRIASTAAQPAGGQNLLAFSGGGAVRPGLESLEYFIYSVQICESMQASGSGFSNPTGCLELYHGDQNALSYELGGDWRPLATAARGMTTGFVDLLNPAARASLNGTTELTAENVRSYNYGIITWSLPIKVKASVALADGTFLYTHDGTTDFETIGADNFRHYYTAPSTPMNVAPAEKAVVLLGNGGNWFKFQNPLSITEADIAERRQWVLDLVFNPEGIVKGFAGDGISQSNLQERNGSGQVIRSVTVPLLDLAPIPHRENEQVVRESYLASLVVGSQAFDVRLELYSVEGDPNRTVFGVDAKTLVTAASTNVPSEMSKISYVVPESDGTYTFQSFNQSRIITNFERVPEVFDTTVANIRCATHADRAGAEGGAAIVVDSCPSAEIPATFRLMGRTRLDGSLPTPPVADAGVPDGGGTPDDAGAQPEDGGVESDAGAN
ncbi:MAG TPA: hypothetical protein VMG12_08980 [Polyangiaceae bacterium]|nr:hypothetical protein [Polyangiaceae bacterium]